MMFKIVFVLFAVVNIITLSSQSLSVSNSDFTSSSEEVDYLSLYKEYLILFKKDLNRVKNFNRLEAFIKNYQFLVKHNSFVFSKNASFTVGQNQFSDYLPEEISMMFSKISYDIPHQVIFSPSTEGYYGDDYHIVEENITLNWATSANYVGQPVLGPVRDQGICGACWAFTSVGAVEASIKINTNIDIYLSPQQLIDCDTQHDRGCQGGNPVYAFEYMMKNGITTWNEYPYTREVRMRW
jgi:hypothetical protein